MAVRRWKRRHGSTAEVQLTATGVQVKAILADLRTPEGVRLLIDAIGARHVDYMTCNAGRG